MSSCVSCNHIGALYNNLCADCYILCSNKCDKINIAFMETYCIDNTLLFPTEQQIITMRKEKYALCITSGTNINDLDNKDFLKKIAELNSMQAHILCSDMYSALIARDIAIMQNYITYN